MHVLLSSIDYHYDNILSYIGYSVVVLALKEWPLAAVELTCHMPMALIQTQDVKNLASRKRHASLQIIFLVIP